MMTAAYILIAVVIAYLGLGVLVSIYLKQTPYSENPLWVMILLWPFFLLG